MPEFYYITLATVPNHILESLKTKVATNGEKIRVLGENENRRIGWESHQNFGLKLKVVSQFINSAELEADDIVLFTDAYDVAYFGTQSEIITRFKTFQKPIVFGAEKYCNPDPHLESEYLDKDREFPYLNSGMFIGYVWALQRCISDYLYDDRDDDQRYWTRQFFLHPELIELDSYNRIFLNTVGIDMEKFKYTKSITATYKNRRPMFVHVNGPDKRLIDELV